MSAVRRRAIFECCKWDPQCEDVNVLCPFAIVLEPDEWNLLSNAARELAREVLDAEREILLRPDLLRRLGLPRSIRALLAQRNQWPARSGPRVMRFDFHWTTDGWLISEANTDVPGGFIEGGGVTRLMAEHFHNVAITAHPADRMADALVQRTERANVVALVHATAYTDDRQVMIYLSQRLRERGADPLLLSPADLIWSNGAAAAIINDQVIAVDAILRFFPAEWLPQLPRKAGWQHFFCASATPQSNPASALVSQSKRFPLLWNNLATEIKAWRRWLPETRDPRHVAGKNHENWVFKPALGRVGEGIGLTGVTAAKEYEQIARAARWWPTDWVAQRRFDALPLSTPDGPVYAAIGVFTIDGDAAGIYGRLAPRPLIDHRARDVAVLVEKAEHTPHIQMLPEQGHESRAIV